MSPNTTPRAAMVAAMVSGFTGEEPWVGSGSDVLMESYSQ
jgi:hypothetical protein